MALREGVIGYLTVDEVSLTRGRSAWDAVDELWVTEYFSRRQPRYYQAHQPMRSFPGPLRSSRLGRVLHLATSRGWSVGQIRYLGEESRRLGRPIPAQLDRQGDARLHRSSPRNTGYLVLGRLA